jgi:hypothetical protein
MLQSKGPDRRTCQLVHLDMWFGDELGPPAEPCERLLDAPPPVQAYPAGSFGPASAETCLRGYPGWRTPWLPA